MRPLADFVVGDGEGALGTNRYHIASRSQGGAARRTLGQADVKSTSEERRGPRGSALPLALPGVPAAAIAFPPRCSVLLGASKDLGDVRILRFPQGTLATRCGTDGSS